MLVNWPMSSNVRKILAEEKLITLDDLPENMLAPPASSEPSSPLDLRDLERRHVLETLRQTKGNKLQAARALGISRRALYRLVEKYRLDSPASGEAGGEDTTALKPESN